MAKAYISSMTQRLRVTTETGSEYVFEAREDGTCWVSGRNVPNPQSKPIGEQVWQVEPGETPTVGQEWLFYALKSLAKDDPMRMPGGGKFTSRVTEVVEV
jgi:hypothetical protein